MHVEILLLDGVFAAKKRRAVRANGPGWRRDCAISLTYPACVGRSNDRLLKAQSSTLLIFKF